MIILHSNNIEELKINQNERPIVTFDFDDTLYDSLECFPTRLEIFRIIIKNISTFIVTSRKSRLKEIEEFCDIHKIEVKGIIYDADDKYKVLSKINSSLHFDDDIDTIRKCTDANIPSVLMGEFLNKNFMKKWMKAKEDVLPFYMKMKEFKTHEDLMRYKFLTEP